MLKTDISSSQQNCHWHQHSCSKCKIRLFFFNPILPCSNRLQTSHLNSLIETVILRYLHESEHTLWREIERDKERLNSAVQDSNKILRGRLPIAWMMKHVFQSNLPKIELVLKIFAHILSMLRVICYPQEFRLS